MKEIVSCVSGFEISTSLTFRVVFHPASTILRMMLPIHHAPRRESQWQCHSLSLNDLPKTFKLNDSDTKTKVRDTLVATKTVT